MKKNKKVFAIVFFAFQLLIIAAMVFYSVFFSCFFMRFGKEYKMRIKPQIYIGGGICNFDLAERYWQIDGRLYIVPDGQSGFYKLSGDIDAPKNAEDFIYYKSANANRSAFPREKIYELKNEPAESYSFEEENAYITVKAFMGKARVTAVYCDGVPIEEYIRNQSGSY